MYVKEGDKIEQGDNLVVLESMKMEHIIKANRPGTVKQVTILAGEFVEAGQILVVME